MARRREAWSLALALVVACAAWGVGAQKPASPDALLGQALHQEQNDGRLDAAIATYRQVIAAPGATREQKARAQFRIGACYEKLGGAEARKAYESVLANYGDQSEFAAQAKARLAAIGKTARPAVASSAGARLIWSSANGTSPNPLNDGGAVPSPDGRFLVYTGLATSAPARYDLYIYDIATGASRLLTPSPGCPSRSVCEMSLYSTEWSPDGSRIAFGWLSASETGSKRAVQVINADGTGRRTLRENADRVAGWSSDGRDVLIVSPSNVRGENSLVAVALADGAERTLVPQAPRLAGTARFSPDGRYVAYVATKASDRDDSDLYLASSDGAQRNVVLDESATAELVGWTADGAGLLFTSDRGRTVGLWTIPVADGNPAGPPQLIKADLGMTRGGTVTPTRDGSVYYSTDASTSDVYVTTLDATGTTLVGAPQNVGTGSLGFNNGAAWSDDGKTLAFLSRAAGRPVSDSLTVIDVPSGAIRRVALAESATVTSSVHALAGNGPEALYLAQLSNVGKSGADLGWFDVRTGELRRRVNANYVYTFSADKARTYQVTRDQTTKTGALIVTDLATQQSREVCRHAELADVVLRVAVSRDERSVAFSLPDPSRNQGVVKVLRTDTCDVREIHRVPGPPTVNMAWSADGSRIFFRGSDLYSIAVANGQLTQYRLDVGLITAIAVHPDGKRLAVTARKNAPREMWVLERFLPAAKDAPAKGATAKR